MRHFIISGLMVAGLCCVAPATARGFQIITYQQPVASVSYYSPPVYYSAPAYYPSTVYYYSAPVYYPPVPRYTYRYRYVPSYAYAGPRYSVGFRSGYRGPSVRVYYGGRPRRIYRW
ncbi:MAG: hypothetical protein R3C19_13710 [Planctomycetaceae bacterium]